MADAWTERPGAWASTNTREATRSDVDRLPPFNGEHLWIVAPTYRVDPTSPNPPVLDHEILLFVAGPVCFWCEQPYEKRLTYRRCKGEPDA